ncbi:MAG: Uma2 family endonuclease [Verrucomicrobia bacterium]|nr:Uma2 family endonuclease [Verrucomicrobiota bacterium]
MQAAVQLDFVSVEDYLAGEEHSEVRHDYIGGAVYAMAGGTTEHNQIVGGLYSALRTHLRGKPCRVFMENVKVRLKISGEDIFYYPDVMVGCDPRDTDSLFLRFPKLLIEVLSEATERLDRREKRWSYQTIETLDEYVLVAQDRIEVTIFRRANEWQPEVLNRLDQVARFVSLDFSLPLAAIYEGVRGPA